MNGARPYLLRAILGAASLLILAASNGPAQPSQPKPPFGLPFGSLPGPDTWLLTQPYGNTVFAYRERRSLYRAGQGLHFGVDLAAPCGTEVVAVGGGVVVGIDQAAHGAGPHNLMIDHPNDYASFYGHLLERPQLDLGEEVRRGQPIAKTGDPDLSCTSRPHLHLEIREAPSHRRAFNPIPLIDADWDRIALVGGNPLSFEQDLTDPRRWQLLSDQPEVLFGGDLLNDYDEPWPPQP
ncbi:MAG TPA: M23 family metallopeptidase [Anaerolineales bacterium]|nr:M23 family metallopeptidase [Anaerolineales bacterium]